MKRIKLVLVCIWEAMMALAAPLCIGLIYMNITGHGKGYGYDMGSEKDISIMLGFFELVVWVLLTVPNSICFFKKMGTFGKKYIGAAAGIMILLFGCGILMIGGWQEFLACFGI